MELTKHLEVLAKRAKSVIGNVIAAYEVKQWPTSRLKKLIEMGMLIRIADATTIKCPCCYKGCSVEPIKGVENDGTEYYEVLCEKEGSLNIAPFFLKQWEITGKIEQYQPKTTPDEQPSIKKGNSGWMFSFNNNTATVTFKGKQLKGLALIEWLLMHPDKDYFLLDLMKEVGQRDESEKESGKIFSDAEIVKIKGAIKGLRDRARLEDDPDETADLERKAEEAEALLRKARNCRGKSRRISEKDRIAVIRNIDTVLKKISPHRGWPQQSFPQIHTYFFSFLLS